MKNCKITVLKTMFLEDIADEYGIDGLGPCDHVKEGEVFYTNGWEMPEGFCGEAWKSLSQFVFALSHGTTDDVFYNNEWNRVPGVALVTCLDGFKPVVFKIERTDEDIVR